MSKIKREVQYSETKEVESDKLVACQIVIDLGNYNNFVEFVDDQDGDVVYLKMNAAYDMWKEKELAKHVKIQMLNFEKLRAQVNSSFNDEDREHKIKMKLVIEFDDLGNDEES